MPTTRIQQLCTLALFTAQVSAFAYSPRIEVEVEVKDPGKLHLQSALWNPEVIVDHVDSEGYELYGSARLINDLKAMGIPFRRKDIRLPEDMADYPSFQEVKAKMLQLESRFPFMRLYSIGDSVQGRELLVMKISDNVDSDELEPEFKYVSSMHGDEITGRELMLRLIEDIGAAYLAGDQRIQGLVNNTEIYIMPSMNPDGSEARRRANANGYDLNRNFPELSQPADGLFTEQPEIETVAMMQFQASRQFSLSANFHGGAEVVNYPWDAIQERHPLDRFVYDLSVRYAREAPYIGRSTEFPNGVTNGFDWYQVLGGMQDWSYRKYNDLQLTIELSDQKWPSYSRIPYYYQENRAALINYMERVHQGAGFVLSRGGIHGTVEVIDALGQRLGTFEFRNSEFYKVLPEGAYAFHIRAGGQQRHLEVTVDSRQHVENGNYVRVDL